MSTLCWVIGIRSANSAATLSIGAIAPGPRACRANSAGSGSIRGHLSQPDTVVRPAWDSLVVAYPDVPVARQPDVPCPVPLAGTLALLGIGADTPAIVWAISLRPVCHPSRRCSVYQSDVVGGFDTRGAVRRHASRTAAQNPFGSRIGPRESIVDRLPLDTEPFVVFGFLSPSFARNGGWLPRGLSDAPRSWSLYE